MDFPVAAEIRAALVDRVERDLGYPVWLHTPGGALGEPFAARMAGRYGWRPDPGHVREFSDINQALQVVLDAATRPGDRVALHTPAYHPFLGTLEEMERPLLPVPMVPAGDGWGFDLDRLDAEVASGGCRALLLVNPQNPTGRAFTRAELTGLAELAERHDLLVLSDEIHADLTYAPHEHIPFASLSPEAAARTVTLTSATKAFNLAGLRCAVAHIGAAEVRAALAARPRHLGGEVGVMGVIATAAAWAEGDAWLADVLAVLDRNRRLLADALPREVGYRVPDATYLAWLDVGALGLGEDPGKFFADQARVLVNSGPAFGPGGDGFVRLNFATSGAVLAEILDRVATALEHRG
ncbi:MAG: aminotransferase class I/II-fold pyridoxal phosphate-dependent enzyme [Streptosporangiales bacterium]|nr:aminotransferase class I/II-fold pyridoxal phosphate-dependent enzyme [Streptosporangiales bacterium]